MDPILDVTRLRLLREVALRGSIAAAAREVGLTPSAVSQALAVLEREAGVALLDRSSRGVHLTGAGHALSERAREIVHLLEEARGDLDRLSGDPAGPVRLATVASAAAFLVSDAAHAVVDRHPQVQLSVSVREPESSIDAVMKGDVDIAVVDHYDGVPLAVPDSVAQLELLTEPLVVVVAAGHPLAAGAGANAGAAVEGAAAGSVPSRPVRLADLSGEQWVMPPVTAACGQAVRFACRTAGFEPRVRWETDDMLLLMRAVAAEHGLTVLPRMAVADDVAEVVVLPLDRPRMRRRLLALTRSSSSERAAIAAVLDQLKQAATS